MGIESNYLTLGPFYPHGGVFGYLLTKKLTGLRIPHMNHNKSFKNEISEHLRNCGSF
jgi:hypothetical protein